MSSYVGWVMNVLNLVIALQAKGGVSSLAGRDGQIQELLGIVARIVEEQSPTKQREDDVRQVNEGQPGVEQAFKHLAQKNGGQQELLNALSETWCIDNQRQHEELINAVVPQPTCKGIILFLVCAWLSLNPKWCFYTMSSTSVCRLYQPPNGFVMWTPIVSCDAAWKPRSRSSWIVPDDLPLIFVFILLIDHGGEDSPAPAAMHLQYCRLWIKYHLVPISIEGPALELQGNVDHTIEHDIMESSSDSKDEEPNGKDQQSTFDTNFGDQYDHVTYLIGKWVNTLPLVVEHV
ncbi:hypothetical protein EDC04DRAFT_2610998 [Pisolithus marmoratus]|nr:hypothetical protein EDC04DRAFT_2610998 [Pisolithus marmoratus]